jgi:hypothetical protein
MSRDKLVSIHMTGVRSQTLGGVSEERWVVPFSACYGGSVSSPSDTIAPPSSTRTCSREAFTS